MGYFLPDAASAFHAEVVALGRAVEWFASRNLQFIMHGACRRVIIDSI